MHRAKGNHGEYLAAAVMTGELEQFVP